MSKEPESKHDTHDTRYGESRYNPPATAEPKAPAPKAAAPRDAAADQLKLLILLATDWLDNDRTHVAEIAALVAGFVAALGPPTVVDVPLVMQNGDTLTCTMGNWQGEPSAYAYEWHRDGVAFGATEATYTVQPDDAGHDLACVVTATNALGSTAAPMSNAIAIPAA